LSAFFSQAESEVSAKGSSKSATRTVLVVDDEPDALRLIQSILTEEGYEVIAAGSADAAIEAFQQPDRRPDILLTDVVMPGMSGPMLAGHLRQIEPGLKVLFMSGYHHRPVVRRYVVEEGFRLIPKPFSVITLRVELDTVMKGSKGVGSGESGS
jgi:two-component system cell cycle sensor histidine kinase/response regulator CckA